MTALQLGLKPQDPSPLPKWWCSTSALPRPRLAASRPAAVGAAYSNSATEPRRGLPELSARHHGGPRDEPLA